MEYAEPAAGASHAQMAIDARSFHAAAAEFMLRSYPGSDQAAAARQLLARATR